MKNLILIGFGFVACSAFAGPSAALTSFMRNGRTATIGYTLTGGPAIVTFDVETNGTGGAWTSVGGEKVRLVVGDVNRRVASDGAHSFKWIADDAWIIDAVAANEARAVVKVWALDNPPDYVAFNISAPKTVFFYPSAEAFPTSLEKDDRWKEEWLVMRRIPAKDVVWRMGSPSTEGNRTVDANDNNEVPHYVKLTQDYYMAIFQFTCRQYAHYKFINEWINYGSGAAAATKTTKPQTQLGYTSTRGSAADYKWPASGHENVDPTLILGWLRTTFPGWVFDLPTEAQWEYACRAGTGTRNFWGDAVPNLNDPNDPIFTYAQFGSYAVFPVGGKKPNPWGLYDMIGNAREVCLDWVAKYPEVTDPENPEVDPKGPTEDQTNRAARGNTSTVQTYARSAWRNNDEKPTRNATDTGLRLVCPAVVP